MSFTTVDQTDYFQQSTWRTADYNDYECTESFFAILIFTATLPVSGPYLILRGISLNRTRYRVEEAKISLTSIVNDLKSKQIQLTSR